MPAYLLADAVARVNEDVHHPDLDEVHPVGGISLLHDRRVGFIRLWNQSVSHIHPLVVLKKISNWLYRKNEKAVWQIHPFKSRCAVKEIYAVDKLKRTSSWLSLAGGLPEREMYFGIF